MVQSHQTVFFLKVYLFIYFGRKASALNTSCIFKFVFTIPFLPTNIASSRSYWCCQWLYYACWCRFPVGIITVLAHHESCSHIRLLILMIASTWHGTLTWSATYQLHGNCSFFYCILNNVNVGLLSMDLPCRRKYTRMLVSSVSHVNVTLIVVAVRRL